MQLPLFIPESTWKAPSISDLPSWKGMKRICIDCETRDEHLKDLGIGVRRGGYVVGISFTIEDTGQSFYLPFRHEGGDNLEEAEVLRYFRENASAFSGQLVGANLSYDLDYLWQEGIFFPNISFYRDIQIADPLIYELHMSYSLLNIGLRYGIQAKDESKLQEAALTYGVSPKGGLWKLPARFVGAYAEQDTRSPLMILRKQEEIIEKEKLWDIWNLESRVLPILVKMRRRGVRIDQDRLLKVEEWSMDEESKALRIVKDATGFDIGLGNVWKAEALVPAFEKIGIRLGTTPTGKPQIDKEALNNIDHPVAKAIARARKVNKLRTTFAESVREYMVDGRIHCTFMQIAQANNDGDQKGARYGRLSCVDPNLQQQPSRDEFAKMWRSIYIAEEGAIWGCNDYSQQEPRWTTHFAGVLNFTGAKEACQKYRDDPTLDNHQFMADLTGLPRKKAKDIYLGLCYGEGGAKLCHDLGLGTRWAISMGHGRNRVIEYYETKMAAMERRYNYEGNAYVWEAAGVEGQAMLDTFNSRAPFILQLAQFAEKRAKQKGKIRTVGGRVLNFTQPNGEIEFTHKALNRLIQGSSADQVKTALVQIDQEKPDAFLNLQVHDELDGSYGSVAEAKGVAEIMRDCIPNTLVPFKVDVETGPSWGEIK